MSIGFVIDEIHLPSKATKTVPPITPPTTLPAIEGKTAHCRFGWIDNEEQVAAHDEKKNIQNDNANIFSKIKHP